MTTERTDYVEHSKTFILVQIEAPHRAVDQVGIEKNLEYLRRCIVDCIKRGESPYASAQMLASHPSLMDDFDPTLRFEGISAGFAFIPATTKTVAYIDNGISRGMQYGIEYAQSLGHPIEFRSLDDPKNDCVLTVETQPLTSGLSLK